MATEVESLADSPPAPEAGAEPATPRGPEPDSPYADFRREIERRVFMRSDSGRWLSDHLLTILAVAASLPALRAPTAWLAICAVAAVVVLSIDSVSRRREEERRKRGSADVVVLPARAVGRVALGVLNPVTWLTVLLGAVVAIVGGAVAAAAIGAVRWLVIEGPDGILAAARASAWAHTLTYAAVLACFLLLRAGGRTAERRAAVLRRATRRMPELVLTLCIVVAVVGFAAFAVAGPVLDVSFVRDADGLGWLPPGLRGPVDEARDDVVAQELDAMTDCLNGADAGRWTWHYTSANPLSDDDVATLVVDPARPPDEQTLATAALVADNDLAPWVERVDVLVGDHPALSLAREGFAHDQPITDAAALAQRASGAPAWLATVAPRVDRARVLDCSARTPF